MSATPSAYAMSLRATDRSSAVADTLGFYTRCKCSLAYNKWLDRRVEWRGLPPQGFNNEFIIFNDKLNCLQKTALKLLSLFFGFVPGFQVFSSFLSYHWRLSNLRCDLHGFVLVMAFVFVKN